MVSREYMEGCALRNARHTVGMAFCRALGIAPGYRTIPTTCGNASKHIEVARYAGMDECFRNERGVLDFMVRG